MNDTPTAPLSPVPPPSIGPAPSTPPPAVPSRRRGGLGILSAVLAIAVLFAVGGVAFAAGRLTAPAAAATGANGNGTNPFRGGGNGGNGSGGNGNAAANGFPGRGQGVTGAFGGIGGGISLSGTVTAVAADSITLRLANGQSVTIPIDGSTTYHKQAGASASDVASGTTVEVTLGGFVRGAPGAGASAAPGASADASGRPGAIGLGGRLGTATDVTITSK